MKKIWIIIIISLIILALVSVIIIKKRKIVITKDNIKYMHFSYSTGNMINSNVSYNLEFKNYRYNVSIKPDNVPETEKKELEIDGKTLEKIVNVLNKYKVYRWNNFHKSDKNVLDGNSFSFSLETKDKKEIDASGYMKWPNNYMNVKGELDSIFASIYNAKKISLDNLEYFSFSYSEGDEVDSNIIYEINKKDDKFIADIKPLGISKDDSKKIEISEDVIKQIENILNNYNVSLWNGYSKHDINVLDGDSFNFSIYTKEEKLNASGYMMWPNNYANVKEKLDNIFNDLYNEGR